jgi:hypothetical protein
MRLSSFLAVVGCFFVGAQLTRAADAPPEVKTLMADKGKTLTTDSFATEMSPDWKVAKGTWAIVDGALKGTEKAEDMHAAVLRRELKTHNLIAHYSFRFDGGKSTSFSLNDPKGHVCRVAITPAGFGLNKDKAGKTSTDKPASLDKVAMPFKAGEWYSITIELCGKDFVASVDDAHVAIGSHDGLDVDKTVVSFPVSGDGVSIKDLTIWEATQKSDWEQTKAKLMAGREKRAEAK